MSPSARRLSSEVATDRFHWQRQSIAAPIVTPFLRREDAAPPVPEVAPAMRDLPSPSAERVQAIEREAFAKGFEAGEREGESAAAVRTDATIQRLMTTIDEIASLRTGLMRRAERELVRLALSMAERVIRREIAIDRELLVVMARVAIDRLGEHAVATIHLHPADCEAALGQRESDQPMGVELVADATLPRGGCVVRSAFGTIDASIDSQMRELSRALLGDETDEQEPAHGLASGS
jgi:flagellar assembly protein FliH